MTDQEAAARLNEFNEQHAQLNSIEDWSMIVLMGLILVYIIVMGIIDNRKSDEV